MNQSQQQGSGKQSGAKKPKFRTDHVTVTPTPPDTNGRDADKPDPDTAATPDQPIDQPIDDGRMIRGKESEAVRPERDVEGHGPGIEDAFDADNRGQR